jgi:hypothetical protein
MALPNGAGGYQLGDGNLNEPVLGYLAVPNTEAGVTAVTLTAAEVTGGILIANPGTTGTTYTLPIVDTASGVTGVNDLLVGQLLVLWLLTTKLQPSLSLVKPATQLGLCIVQLNAISRPSGRVNFFWN